ncbi:aminoglycoside phosphotransferase family protein [Mesorhizobium sp. CN5-321]
MRTPSFPDRWKIGGAEMIAETFSSRIWKVVRADGSPAVVKALKLFDDVEDELRGAHFLAWRRGEGAVRLLGRDGRKMLVEYAGTRHLADVLDRDGDDAATEIAAEVIVRLHSPSPHLVPGGLQPLRARFAALFARAGADREDARQAFYIEAASLADRILDDQTGIRPLHGDLHHENMLQSPRGWLAIDPKGVLGDPCFDAANMFYNPLDRDDLCLSPDRISAMAATLSRSINVDPRRLLDHAIAYGCLSAALHAEDGNRKDEERELDVASAVRRVRLSL